MGQNMEGKIIHLVEKNIWEHTGVLDRGKDFFKQDTKVFTKRGKMVDYVKIKNFSSSNDITKVKR